MNERMEEATVSAASREELVSEQSLINQAYLNKAEGTVEKSKFFRQNFDGKALEHTIEDLQKRGLDQSEEYFAAVQEKLQSDCGVIRVKPGEDGFSVVLSAYAYDDLLSFESSQSYQLLQDMQEQFPELYEIAQRTLIEPIRAHYEALDRNAENDVIVLYDDAHKEDAQQLSHTMDYYTVEAFNIEDENSYAEPDLLCALHHATVMVRFCDSVQQGLLEFRTHQFKEAAQASGKGIIFVTAGQSEDGDNNITVSLENEDWKEQINKKTVVMIDGAPPKELLLRTLVQQEEMIVRLTEDKAISPENYRKLCAVLEKQIEDLEDYAVLYGEDMPVLYAIEDLEEIEQRFQVQAKYTKSNIERWLNKLKRDGKRIAEILANQKPIRFYERYMQLCHLIDAQQEHRDKLLEHFSLEELKQKVGDVVVDRLQLHAIRHRYQTDLKNTYLEKYMRPFDRIFTDCPALDCINPFRIEQHRENFDKFEACGIYLSAADGLTYWSKRAFMRALYEKQYDQNVITSQIDRMTDFSKSIDHFLRDYANPSFNPNALKKQKADLTALIQEFRKKWSLPLSYKQPIYKGYRGRVCFIKYTDEEKLNEAVESAIQKYDLALEKKSISQENISSLLRKNEAQKNTAEIFYDMAQSYMDLRRMTDNSWEKSEYLKDANECYLRASELGHSDASMKISQHAENGVGLPKNLKRANAYLSIAAHQGHGEAQYQVAAEEYKNGNLAAALRWFDRVAHSKSSRNKDACSWLFSYYCGKGQNDQAVEYSLLKLKNNADSFSCIGVEERLFVGRYLYQEKKDYKQAFVWLNGISSNEEAVLLAGECALRNHDLDAALEKYQQIPVEKIPLHAQKRLADYALKKEQYAQALKFYLPLVDTDLQIKGKVAQCYVKTSKYLRAAEVYGEIFAEQNDIRLKKNIADAYFSGGEYDMALQHYDEYSQVYPQNEVFLRMAKCCLALAREQEACSYYARCIDEIKDPQDICFLADLFYRCDQVEYAIVCYEKMLKADKTYQLPADFVHHLFLGGYYGTLVRWYEQYDLPLENMDLVMALGDHYRICGKKERALEYYELCCEQSLMPCADALAFMVECYADADNQALANIFREKLGDLYYSQSEFIQAAAAYGACRSDFLSNEKTESIADALYSIGEIDLSLTWYTRLYQRIESDALAKNIADRLWAAGCKPKAVVWYELYANHTQDTEIQRRIADYCFTNGMPEDSVIWYRASAHFAVPMKKDVLLYLLQHDTDDEWASVWNEKLGDILIATGKIDAAVACYVKCEPQYLPDDKMQLIADTYLDGDLIDNALPWYERYYQSTRDDAVAQRLADVLWGKGRETDAVAWYKKSAQATRSAIVAKRIADYHFTHGQQDISIEWYQKAVYSTEPLAKDALLFLTEHSEAAGDEKWMSIWSEKLGDAWHSEGDLPRAIECYAACEPKKLPSPKHLLVADTLMKQDKLMAALKWYKSYYDRTHDADLAKKVADQLWHKEKKERAVAWYKRYLSTRRSPHAVAIVGQYYIDQGEKDKAAQFYEEWSEVPKCLSKDAIAFMMEYCEERKNYAGSMLWAEKMGDEYCADGDTAKASEFYAKCDPKVLSPDKQLLVGDMYFARQEFTQGLKWYKRSYTQTKDVKLVRKSADALWKAGERKNAIVWYGEYAEKTRDPEIIRLVADYYISNKLENDAAIFYERFRHWATECIHSEGIAFMVRYYTDQKNHQGMEAWNAKYGDVLYAAGKKDEAIACYMQCSPDSLTYSMRIAVADAYFEKKEYDQGEHWYEACYKQSKDAALAQITADRLWDAGLEPRAISWYERYLSNNQNADVLKKIAAYWLEKSNFSEAQTWYDRYDAASSDAELSRKLGDLFLSAKQLKIAVGYYEKYIRSVTAPDAYVYVQLGQCYYAMEKNNMAYEKLAVAGWMLDRYKTKNPPSAPFEVQENDAVLVIENKYVFLKKDGKIFAAPATMIQEYRITVANLFNKGKAVLKLQKDRISQELPEIFEVSDNLKRDAAVHAALKEALSKRHVAICNV